LFIYSLEGTSGSDQTENMENTFNSTFDFLKLFYKRVLTRNILVFPSLIFGLYFGWTHKI